ncbi:MAG TPA: nuclear transport factor 2 family protein [Caulobacteraceae bacterium]
MTDAKTIARDYIDLWNETDAKRRGSLMASQWTNEATYVDPLASVAGPDEIGAYIGGVHQRFPDFRFALLGEPDGHGDHVRFSWSLGPAGGEAPIEGSDVVTTSDGRIAAVIGFLDKVPQPA